MLRIQIPQSAIPALRTSSCKFAEIRLNEPDEVRYKNYLPNRNLPPAPECAELHIEQQDAVDFYAFLLSIKEGRIGGGAGEYTEGYLALEEAMRPFSTTQLEWLDDGEGMEHIWGPGWMVAYHRFTDRDRTDMCLMDFPGGSMSFKHGDHRDAYKSVAHLGIKALREKHYELEDALVRA
jgi:hypothetical protein